MSTLRNARLIRNVLLSTMTTQTIRIRPRGAVFHARRSHPNRPSDAARQPAPAPNAAGSLAGYPSRVARSPASSVAPRAAARR